MQAVTNEWLRYQPRMSGAPVRAHFQALNKAGRFKQQFGHQVAQDSRLHTRRACAARRRQLHEDKADIDKVEAAANAPALGDLGFAFLSGDDEDEEEDDDDEEEKEASQASGTPVPQPASQYDLAMEAVAAKELALAPPECQGAV